MKEPKLEPTNVPQSTGGGTKLSTIFLVVLGLHVLVIAGILAYNLLKGDTSVTDDYAAAEMPASPPPVEATVEEPAAQPVVQTSGEETAPVVAVPAAGEAIMPSPDDPIWSLGHVMPRPLDEERTVAESPAAVGAAVTPPAPVPPVERAAPAQTAQHVVQAGDSLSRLARRYGTSVQAIQQANGLQGSMIRVGQSLVVPAASGTPVANTPAAIPPASVAGTGGTRTHTVAKGETLWAIARQHGVTAQDLARANGITDAAKLKIGARLVVPDAGGRREMAQPQVPPQPGPTVVENTDMAMRP